MGQNVATCQGEIRCGPCRCHGESAGSPGGSDAAGLTLPVVTGVADEVSPQGEESQQVECQADTGGTGGLRGMNVASGADKSPVSTQTGGQGSSPMSYSSIDNEAAPPVGEYRLTLADVLDIFSICSRSLPVLRAALGKYASLEEQAHAVATAAVTQQGDYNEVLPYVMENLHVVGELPKPLKDFLRHTLDQSKAWNFDGSGRIDTAPRLTDKALQSLTVSQLELADVRRLACAHVPPGKQGYGPVRQLRELQFGASRCAETPTAVVAVGPPGSGKTYLLRNWCLPLLQQRYATPPLESYVGIDPDYFISELLDNNNMHREMANFCNHESFMCAIGQRRHMLFDHTGKDLINTCGRVISRLKEANYRVYMCIVLANFESCQKRIKERFEETGRNVADSYLSLVFEALQKTVPWYLQKQETMADAVLLYSNNYGTTSHTPILIGGGSGADPQYRKQSVDLASELLRLPQES